MAAWDEPLRRKPRRRPIEPEEFAAKLAAFKQTLAQQQNGRQRTSAPSTMKPAPSASSSPRPTPPTVAQVAQVVPTCAECAGVGWVHLDVPVGHSQFGQFIRCGCQAQADRAARYERAAKASNLTPELRVVRFTDITPQDEDVHEAKTALEAFASAPSGWIILSGAWGTNKTRLMAATANALLDAGQHWPLYVVVPDFLDYVRAAYDKEVGMVSESANDRIEQAINADVLMLDDLGAQSSTPWADEKLFRIINARYNAGAPLVVTTNLVNEAMEPRIRSRLFDLRLTQGRMFRFGGPDQRATRRMKGGK